MEDSFKVRVDKAFGSLEASSSSSSSIKLTSSSLSSLWCLTDEEIQRNEWIHDKITPHKDIDEEIHRIKNPKPHSSFLHGILATEPSTSHQDLESDIQELDDEDDDDQQPQVSKPDDHSNEEWNIRSSVAMDCTLDNEEEEDAYDKVAVGKEELAADRFYMKDVNDYEVEIDSNNELPNSLTDAIRDPRANHMAAKLRLKEDDESAKKLGLQVSENKFQESILSEKRTATGSEVMHLPRDLSRVPDYIRNPSKYTHYTFDSMDDVDEEANRKAYMDFFSLIKGSSGMEIEHDVQIDSSTSIIFTPKKKSTDVSMKKSKVDGYEEEYTQKKVVPISIADEDIEDSEVCEMDEDEPVMATNKSSSLQKSGRRYRTKGSDYVE